MADRLLKKEEGRENVWVKYKNWFFEVERTGMNKSYKMAYLIADMPMTKWNGSAKENLVAFNVKDAFSINLMPAYEELKLLYSWTEEIAEYRLHAYFERKAVLRN